VTDHQETYAVAWALYHARCLTDDATRDEIDTAWGLLNVRNFWLGQAQIALDAQALYRLEQGNPTASPDGK
jgi:hypothetical protein